MFKRLFGMLVPGLVIFFPVVYGGGAMRVGSEFMEFGSSLVRIIWDCIRFLGVHPNIIPRFDLSNCGHSFPQIRPTDENRTLIGREGVGSRSNGAAVQFGTASI